MTPMQLRNRANIDIDSDDELILSDLFDKPFQSKYQKARDRVARLQYYQGTKSLAQLQKERQQNEPTKKKRRRVRKTKKPGRRS